MKPFLDDRIKPYPDITKRTEDLIYVITLEFIRNPVNPPAPVVLDALRFPGFWPGQTVHTPEGE